MTRPKSPQVLLPNTENPLEVQGCAQGYSQQEILNNISRHSRYDPGMPHEIKNIPEIYLLNKGYPLAVKYIKMIKEIFTEAYRAEQFTRTKMSAHKVLYGVVSLQHHVEDLVLDYFHERWPQFIVILFNKNRRRSYWIDERGRIASSEFSLMETVEFFNSQRPRDPYFEDVAEEPEELFQALYESQFIRERENRKYFQRMIPSKCFELPGMKGGIEKQFRNNTLDSFFNSKPKKQESND